MPYGEPKCSVAQIESYPSGSIRSPISRVPRSTCESDTFGGVAQSWALTRGQSLDWKEDVVTPILICSTCLSVGLSSESRVSGRLYRAALSVRVVRSSKRCRAAMRRVAPTVVTGAPAGHPPNRRTRNIYFRPRSESI